MLAFASTCTGCHADLWRTAATVRLLDLTFHTDCAPRCQTCDIRLSSADRSRWRYTTRTVSDRCGSRVEPATCWCSACWALSSSLFGAIRA